VSSDPRNAQNEQIREFHKSLILSKTRNVLLSSCNEIDGSSLKDEMRDISTIFSQICEVSKGLLTKDEVSSTIREFRLNARLRKSIGSFFRKSLRLHSRTYNREEEKEMKNNTYDGDTPSSENNEEDDEDSEEDIDTEEEEDNDDDYEPISSEISSQLVDLNWISPHLRISLNEALYEEIRKRVHVVASKGFDRRRLKSLRLWLHSAVSLWVVKFIRNENAEVWTKRLSFHLHDTFARTRIESLFSIIRDFPDSEPALHDLRRCMRRTQVQTLLIESLKNAFRKRLLHPGVSTDMIITLYVNTIRALQILDPRGVLLEQVSPPIRSYLRRRSDTVRCVVKALTNDSGEGSELFDELRLGVHENNSHKDTQKHRMLDMTEYSSDEEGDSDTKTSATAMKSGTFWTPEPIAVDPRKRSKSRRTADIISTLVRIFGSSEIFVNEYQIMLADKLIGNRTDFETDREVHTLELLKLRFGESSLHQCEIMLKDMGDSRRVNANLLPKVEQRCSHEDDEKMDDDESNNLVVDTVSATLISRHFWPSLQAGSENLRVHPKVQTKLDAFAKEYSILRNPRILEWRHGLGTVEIELEFQNDETVEFRVSPELATIVSYFGDQEELPMENLPELTGLSMDIVCKRVDWWINQGVLERKDDDVVGVVKKYVGATSCVTDSKDDSNDGEDHVSSAEMQHREQMRVYESYVIGMLSNFRTLPVDRIHNMLKMFVNSDEHKYVYYMCVCVCARCVCSFMFLLFRRPEFTPHLKTSIK